MPKSPIGEAVGCARARWTALTRYLDDGDLAIDNSVSERALRRVCVGRNTWLFCGSDVGGQRAAILYRLVATRKEHGLDPWACVRDVFARIPTHPDRRRAALLPRHWLAARAATAWLAPDRSHPARLTRHAAGPSPRPVLHRTATRARVAADRSRTTTEQARRDGV